jgi:hypothetical protein
MVVRGAPVVVATVDSIPRFRHRAASTNDITREAAPAIALLVLASLVIGVGALLSFRTRL